MKCYLCLSPLSKENSSIEHIIPDSLGGQISSSVLLCKACNNKTGHEMDAKLVEQLLPFAVILDVKRSRSKKNKSVLMRGDKGSELRVGKHFSPNSIMYLHLPNGKKITLPAKSDDDFEGLVKRKVHELTKKYGEIKVVKGKEYHLDEKFHFANMPDELGGKGFFLAITKMAVSYALTNDIDPQFTEKAISLLRNEKKYNDISYYYPKHYVPYQSASTEISHVLYLKADSISRVLYVYIELFNSDNCLVLLSTEYDGANHERTYVWDTVSNQESPRSVKIKLTRQHFLDIELFARSVFNISSHAERRKTLTKKLEELQ